MEDFTLQNKAITIVGKRNSGKSQIIKYLLSYSISNKEFNKIFIICPTNSINHFYDSMVSPNNIKDSYDEEWVELLISKMSKINDGKTSQKDKPYNLLLILDDVANDKAFHHSKTIRQLYGRGRHSFISIICVGQQLHSLATIQRSNADYLICGQMNSNNIVLLCDEFRAPILDKKQFIELYKMSTSNYSFFVINNNTIKNTDDVNNYYGTIKAKIEK